MVIKQDADGDIHGSSPTALAKEFVSIPKEEYLALYNIYLIAKSRVENRELQDPALGAAIAEYREAKRASDDSKKA